MLCSNVVKPKTYDFATRYPENYIEVMGIKRTGAGELTTLKNAEWMRK